MPATVIGLDDEAQRRKSILLVSSTLGVIFITAVSRWRLRWR